jgi:hypothetical protein
MQLLPPPLTAFVHEPQDLDDLLMLGPVGEACRALVGGYFLYSGREPLELQELSIERRVDAYIIFPAPARHRGAGLAR